LVEYYGNPEGTGAAHGAIESYCKQQGLVAGEPAIEEYVTDPASEPDTSKWLTRIYYPLVSKG
jgi:effector-binding domain-containing protein